MPYLTQIHILELSAMCQTARVLVVFRDDKWSTPNEGDFVLTFSFVILFPRPSSAYLHVSAAVIQVLNENSPTGAWFFFQIVNTAMFSSREKKTAWVFRR